MSINVQQQDRDRANELEQKLGTLAQDFRAMYPAPNSEQQTIFSRSCFQLTSEIMAKHREQAEQSCQKERQP